MCAHSLQLCLTLYNPMVYSPLGSSVHEIFQARILERLPCPTPGNLPEPGIKPMTPVSPALQADSLPWSHEGNPQEVLYSVPIWQN